MIDFNVSLKPNAGIIMFFHIFKVIVDLKLR